MGQWVSSYSTSRPSSEPGISGRNDLLRARPFTARSTTSTAQNESTGPRLVIAIDFGSYACGYALQWRSDFERDRLTIYANKEWNDGGSSTYKTLTAVLLKPDHSVAAFGFEAETKFCTVSTDETDGDQWFFFRGFKMRLYHERAQLDSKTTVEDAKGRHLPATLVLGKSIQYIKDHALNHLRRSNLAFNVAAIKWVITVPAIWSDRAKIMMREAATTVAGIYTDNLTIALEPECAAIYCTQLTRHQLEIDGVGAKVRHIASPGSVIMVVDIGGGTVDITTMRVQEGGTMEHVHMSGGGPHGGTKVDEEFFTKLSHIIGADVWDKFVQTHQREYLDMRTDFERSKRTVSHPSESDTNTLFQLQIAYPLVHLWEQKEGKSIQEILKSAKFQELGMGFAHSRLTFPLKFIWALYAVCAKEILTAVNDTLSHPNLEGLSVSAVITVGGFSMSSFLIEALRQGLKDKGIPVVRPEDTALAVMKGAVLFGHKEDIIQSRIMSYTYGVSCVMEFNERHREEHKFESGGKVWANNCFRKHVTLGQAVNLGEWIVDKEYLVDDSQTTTTIHVFSSENTDPIHTTDEGCSFVGKVEFQFPQAVAEGGAERIVKVAIQFGGTELQVKAVCNDGSTFKKRLNLRS